MIPFPANFNDDGIYNPPINDPITKTSADMLSDIWVRWFSTSIQTIQNYITPDGFLLQSFSNEDLALIAKPFDGLTVFNSDDQNVQIYVTSLGGWKALAFAP
jgi:hypothetical protein